MPVKLRMSERRYRHPARLAAQVHLALADLFRDLRRDVPAEDLLDVIAPLKSGGHVVQRRGQPTGHVLAGYPDASREIAGADRARESDELGERLLKGRRHVACDEEADDEQNCQTTTDESRRRT